MASAEDSNVISLVYKKINDLSISLDIHPPRLDAESNGPGSAQSHPRVPAVIYFHAGGLAVGERKSWFPAWLHDRVTSSGIAFISADYRLIPPSNGFDVLQDVVDLFSFISHGLNDALSATSFSFEIDADRLAVAGTSAGGMCAYLAATHASPKPKALLSMYGMGGNWLDPHMFTVKTEPFFLGYEILDPAAFSDFFYPSSKTLPAISGSALRYHPADSATPGYPANPRMQLARVFIQQGVFLDYWTGKHDPSLSAHFRSLLSTPSNQESEHSAESAGLAATAQKLRDALPEDVHTIFPELHVSSAWPPAFLVHGERDSAVHATESQNVHKLLRAAGVEATLRIVEGEEHSFDYRAGAVDKYGGPGGLYDDVRAFLVKALLG